MKEIFRNYEEVSGCKSLIRFEKFIELKCSKVNCKKLKNLLEEFEKEVCKNNMYVRKDYLNFRNYVFSKVK